MSEGLIPMHNRISQAQKMRMLNKQTLCKPWTKYTQKAEERQNRLRKEFTKIQGGGTQKNAEASTWDVTGTWNNDNNDNNKHNDYVKWMESVSIF